MNLKFLKIISLSLVLLMSLGLCAFAEEEAPVPSFTDLSADDWAYADIMALAARGIISGGGDGTICPDNGITKQEVAKLLLEARGNKVGDTAPVLSVADPESVADWAKGYVALAVEKGILTGNTLGEVKADSVVTRAELAAMIVRSIDASTEGGDEISFADVSADAWYAESVECAKTLGIVTGYADGTFKGEASVTRREAFVMIQRLVGLLEALEG